MTIPELINNVITNRQQKLPKFQEQARQVQSLEIYVSELSQHLTELLQVEPNQQVEKAYHDFKSTFSPENLAGFKDIMQEVVERASRQTVNIGVSGVARVGKSTLLQAISGLEDDQIPTGKTVPVTAVRSTIHHSNEKSCAELDMYSWEEFRKEVLEVYAEQFNLSSVPRTPDDVAKWKLPDISDDLFARLKYIQGSFHSYRQYLTGRTEIKELHEIRPFLTYSENNDPTASRPYLAVKRARVYCQFPQADVENLTLMDLPGLGEVSLDIENLHVQDLRRDVDLVLLIKRAEQGMGFWKDSDRRTIDILEKAKGHVRSLYDYMFIVNNAGGLDEKPVTDMLDHIQHNYGKSADTTILHWNQMDQASKQVLVPVLKHLATRLPVMDEQVFQGASESTTKIRRQLQSHLSQLQAALKDAIPMSQTENEAIRQRTRNIRSTIAVGLGKYQQELQSGNAKKEYQQTLESIIASLKKTINDGFGQGTERWLNDCRESDLLDKGMGTFIHTEINSIRTMIGNSFSAMDINLSNHLNDMRTRIAAIFKDSFGGMISEEPSVHALKGFVQKISRAECSCEHTVKTIQEILNTQITYRAHLFQFVSPTLDELVWDKQIEIILKDLKKKKEPQALLKSLQKISLGIVEQIQKDLDKQAELAVKVIEALFNGFEDQFIRSRDAELEFERIVQHFRLEIDESYFSSLKDANLRVEQIHRSINRLYKAIEF